MERGAGHRLWFRKLQTVGEQMFTGSKWLLLLITVHTTSGNVAVTSHELDSGDACQSAISQIDGRLSALRSLGNVEVFPFCVPKDYKRPN
jgi:hypothetical protein